MNTERGTNSTVAKQQNLEAVKRLLFRYAPISRSDMAKALGLTTAGLLGRDGGKLLPLCDCAVIVPEQETFKIQELHLPVYHALCQMLEEYFF